MRNRFVCRQKSFSVIGIATATQTAGSYLLLQVRLYRTLNFAPYNSLSLPPALLTQRNARKCKT